MSRTLFENSKAALAFAGITIVGTAIVIGPSEGGGVLDRTADSYVEQREEFVEEVQTFAEEQSVPDEVFDPDSGWGGTGGEVFGEFMPDDMTPGASEPKNCRQRPRTACANNAVSHHHASDSASPESCSAGDA